MSVGLQVRKIAWVWLEMKFVLTIKFRVICIEAYAPGSFVYILVCAASAYTRFGSVA